jgi:putative MATE family efflux protein
MIQSLESLVLGCRESKLLPKPGFPRLAGSAITSRVRDETDERSGTDSISPETVSEALDRSGDREMSSAPSPVALGIWELAWPTIVSFASVTAVRWADFAMVGSLGPDALAAVGLGGQVYWLIQSLGMLVPTGLVAVLSRAIGARDHALADASLRQGILLSAVIGLISTLVFLPFTEYSIELYGVGGAVVTQGSAYVYWLLWGTLPLSVSLVFGTALRAAGDAKTPLYIGIASNLINLVLNWILIYGNLGAPRLGVAGAAIASSLSMVVQLILFWGLWQRGKLILAAGQGSFRPDYSLIRRLGVIGYPAALEGALFQVGLLGFQRIMSIYGVAAIAAYNVGAQILSLSFLPGIGFATAASTLVGQHLGDRSPKSAARSARRAIAGAVASMTAMGIAIALGAEPLARVFTDDLEVVRLTVHFILILALVQPLMAIEFSVGGALRGAGDTMFPLVAIFVGLFLCRLLPVTLLVMFREVSIEIVWSALILDYLVKAVMLLYRFRRGKWKALEV